MTNEELLQALHDEIGLSFMLGRLSRHNGLAMDRLCESLGLPWMDVSMTAIEAIIDALVERQAA